MFHWIIFLLQIVSSLSWNFKRFSVCFQSFMNIACRSTQNAARIKRFLRLHIVIKSLNKNKHNKFFVMLKRNCVDVHSRLSFALVKSDYLLAVYWVILEIFWTVSQKAHHWSSWILSILNECNLSRIIVRFCILSEVCMINTEPHSTVSPQMWCIKSIKDLLARFCKANLSNAKNSAWSIF